MYFQYTTKETDYLSQGGILPELHDYAPKKKK